MVATEVGLVNASRSRGRSADPAVVGVAAAWSSARHVERSVHRRYAAARRDHLPHDCWGRSPSAAREDCALGDAGSATAIPRLGDSHASTGWGVWSGPGRGTDGGSSRTSWGLPRRRPARTDRRGGRAPVHPVRPLSGGDHAAPGGRAPPCRDPLECRLLHGSRARAGAPASGIGLDRGTPADLCAAQPDWHRRARHPRRTLGPVRCAELPLAARGASAAGDGLPVCAGSGVHLPGAPGPRTGRRAACGCVSST